MEKASDRPHIQLFPQSDSIRCDHPGFVYHQQQHSFLVLGGAYLNERTWIVRHMLLSRKCLSADTTYVYIHISDQLTFYIAVTQFFVPFLYTVEALFLFQISGLISIAGDIRTGVETVES